MIYDYMGLTTVARLLSDNGKTIPTILIVYFINITIIWYNIEFTIMWHTFNL